MNEPPEWEKPEDPYVPPHGGDNSGALGTGGSCLRMFVLWVLPAVVVPMIIGLFIQVWPIGATIALGFLFVMGIMQSADSAADSGAFTKPQWPKVLLYVAVQVILIPLIWFTVVLGICAAGAKF